MLKDEESRKEVEALVIKYAKEFLLENKANL